jgi:hypothetical protein
MVDLDDVISFPKWLIVGLVILAAAIWWLTSDWPSL